MIRREEIGLGAALLLLGAIGLFSGASTWLAGANIVAALWALATALVIRPDQHGDIAVGLPIVLAISLLVIWLCAFTAGATPWLTWMTLAAAAAAAVEADDAMPGGILRHVRH
jgi:hypothetical protein